jgi:hypothetical protein
MALIVFKAQGEASACKISGRHVGLARVAVECNLVDDISLHLQDDIQLRPHVLAASDLLFSTENVRRSLFCFLAWLQNIGLARVKSSALALRRHMRTPS